MRRIRTRISNLPKFQQWLFRTVRKYTKYKLERYGVSVGAIGSAVRSDQVHLYDGGHQLFASTDRRAAIDEVLAELP